jgi:hypothetical protein
LSWFFSFAAEAIASPLARSSWAAEAIASPLAWSSWAAEVIASPLAWSSWAAEVIASPLVAGLAWVHLIARNFPVPIAIQLREGLGGIFQFIS